MFLGLCLIGMTLLGWVLATAAARPAGPAPRRGDLDRRLRLLRRHPERVTFPDVESLLLAESVPVDTVSRTMARAASRRICARTMWRWAQAHGAARLVMVVDAGLAEDTLLDHLDAGTGPDWTALTLFAGLAADTVPAGIPLAELVDLDVVPALQDLTFPADLADWSTASPTPLELRQFDDLPPISGPGLTPFLPIAAWDDGDGQDRWDGRDGWSAVA